MNDELRRRISDAIDTPAGLSGDAELTALLAADAEATRYAQTLTRLGDAMANWPVSAPNDDAFEAIATRIEQRLEEELPHLANVTGLPEFDDDDALGDATAALLGAGAVTSGEFELEDAESIPPPARPAPPKLVFPKPGAATLPKPAAASPSPAAIPAKPLVGKPAMPPPARLRAVPPPQASLGSQPQEGETAARPPAPRGLFGAPVDAPKKVAPSIPPPEPVEAKAKAVEAIEPGEPARDSIDELVPIESKDVLLSGETLAAVAIADAKPPPPPPSAVPPPAPPKARRSSRPKPLGQIQTKKVKKKSPPVVEVNEKNDRFSFPSIPPAAAGAPIMSLEAPKPAPEQGEKKRRGGVGWMAGLAAAAAVGLAVFAGTNLMQSEPPGDAAAEALAMGPVAPASPAAATPEAVAVTAGPAQAPAAETADEGYGGGDDELPAEPPMAAATPSDPGAEAIGGGGGSGGAHLLGAHASSGGGSPGGLAVRRARGASAAAPAELPRREVAPTRTTGSAGRAGESAGGSGSGASAPSSASSGSTGSAGAAPPPLPPPPRISPEERADLPEHPTRGAVLAAVQSVEPAVRACGEDQHGVADVFIVVANSGRVTTATVSGAFAGTPVGSCVARAVRRARFPAFSADRFEFQYPFHL